MGIGIVSKFDKKFETLSCNQCYSNIGNTIEPATIVPRSAAQISMRVFNSFLFDIVNSINIFLKKKPICHERHIGEVDDQMGNRRVAEIAIQR